MRSPNAFLWIWIGLVLIGLLVLVYAKYAATTVQDTASTESRTETPEVDPPKTDPLRKDPAAEDPTAVDPSVSAPLVPVTPAPVDPRPLVVIEATRAPARDARVALVARGEAQWRTTAGVSVRVIPERVLWEAVTDAEGRIPWPPEGDVPPGSYALRVTQKGYAPATRAVTLPAERFEEPIVLTHGGTLTATGLPDAGIPVLASSREGALYHARSNAGGEAAFDALPRGTYALLIGDPGSVAVLRPMTVTAGDDPGYTHTIAHDERLVIDMTDRAGALAGARGRVKDADHGWITLRARSGTPHLLRTHALGSDGSFVFAFVPPGSYELAITPSLGRVHVEPLTLAAGDRRQEIEIDFPLSRIAGTVVGADALSGRADIEVTVSSVHTPGELITLTDREGRFAFEGLVPGMYRLALRAAAPGAPIQERQVLVKRAEASNGISLQYITAAEAASPEGGG